MLWQCKVGLEICLYLDVPLFVNNCHRSYNREGNELELTARLRFQTYGCIRSAFFQARLFRYDVMMIET